MNRHAREDSEHSRSRDRGSAGSKHNDRHNRDQRDRRRSYDNNSSGRSEESDTGSNDTGRDREREHHYRYRHRDSDRDRDRDGRNGRSRDGRSSPMGDGSGSQELFGGRRRGRESRGGGGGSRGGSASFGSGDPFIEGRNGGSVTLPFPALSSSSRPKRGDWECPKCHAFNFARRDRCFGCGAPGGGSNKGFYSAVPTNVLRISGLRRSCGRLPTPEEVALSLKEFAPVKDAHVVRDTWSGIDLPIYYAEFSCVEHARHTHDTAASAPAADGGAGVEKGGGFFIDGAKVSIRFAAAGEPPASSSEKALKVFQDGQSAARLATLESDEVTQASRERSEAHAQVRAEARVDTGTGLGTGSLALAFEQSANASSIGGGEPGAGFGRGAGFNGARRGRGVERGGSRDGDRGAAGASREVVRAALEKMLNPPEWPPSFQEAGAAYTFDGASGYFYESSTGVYYDPKSKLYCKDSRWHRHTPGQDPAYTPVEQEQHRGEGMDQRHPLSANASASFGLAAGGVSLPLTTISLQQAISQGVASGDASGNIAMKNGNSSFHWQPNTNADGDAANATAASQAGVLPPSVTGTSNTGNFKRPGTLPVGSVAGGKKTKIAFGFKGIKLAKPSSSSGGGGGGGVGSGGEDGGGASDAGGMVGVVDGGGLAKKRRLQDVSKWNARMLEAHEGAATGAASNKSGAPTTTGQTAQPLHIAPRKKSSSLGGPPSYDPPAPLVPPLPAPLSHLKLPSEEEPVKPMGKNAALLAGGVDVGDWQRNRGIFEGRRNGGAGGGEEGDAAGVVVACLLCRRSFASAEMLDKHERKSKLHRENLEKAAAEAQT